MFIDVAHAMGQAAGGGQASGGFLAGPIPMLMIIFGIFYFLMFRPQKKKQSEHKNMLDSLKRGDKVMTASGIYGRLTEVKDFQVTLDVGNGVLLNVNRGYIAGLSEPRVDDKVEPTNKNQDKKVKEVAGKKDAGVVDYRENDNEQENKN